MVYGLGLVAVVSAGLLRVQRVNLGQMARHLVIWVAVIAVLAVGYSYRGEDRDGALFQVRFHDPCPPSSISPARSGTSGRP